ncbi:MAG: hypothetical protein COB07_01435 [Sulfurovum sp.]|nr:MAG: hypothetical protein COB07_01435 [Sulfurovum sp.]
MKYGNYTIDEDSNSSVSKIVKAIAIKSNVIEFGSSYGYILKYLKDHKQCTVQGYEIDKEAVDLANEHGIPTEWMDLDVIQKDFFENLDTNIDYIICADVLEHLKNITYVVKLISTYLEKNKNCTLLISFPNITYYGVVDQLLHGKFQYKDLGILDHTHLRFFDKYELEKLFNNNNLEMKSIECINIDPKDSEFKVKLDNQVVDILEAYNNENYLTYQYVIELQYSEIPTKKLTQDIPKISAIKDWNNKLNSQIIELSDIISRKDNQIIELNTLAHKQQDDIETLTKELDSMKRLKRKYTLIKNKIKSFLGIK